jgi:citrate synthase
MQEPAAMSQAVAAKGLEGVIAASTAVSHVYGEEGRLVYRGYDIHELAGRASFEEVVHLLWHGELPSAGKLDALTQALAADRDLDATSWQVLESAQKDALPMDVLRTVVSAMGTSEKAAEAQSAEAAAREAVILTA